LALAGGHPGSGELAARMWVSPLGFTPVDAAALRVGDARYHDPAACPPAGSPSHAVGSTATVLGAILATIRTMESGGDYTAEARSSTASGAYQFIDGSWGGYGGYARARDAPPAVQDAKAAELATAILAANRGHVSTVPVSWYLGHVPVGDEWDTVPPGNAITPRDYQRRWMATYAQLTGRPETLATAGPEPDDASTTCHTVIVDAGSSGDAHLVLTEAHTFVAETSGRAIPAIADPCDPAREAPAGTPADVVTAGHPGTQRGIFGPVTARRW
jgi:hypothetical protein